MGTELHCQPWLELEEGKILVTEPFPSLPTPAWRWQDTATWGSALFQDVCKATHC